MGGHLDLPLPLFSPWVLADCQATVGVKPYCPFLLTLEPQTSPYSDLELIGGQVTPLPSLPYSAAFCWPHGPGCGEPGIMPESPTV